MEDKQKPKIENEEISVRESTRISNLHQRDDAPVHIDDFDDVENNILKFDEKCDKHRLSSLEKPSLDYRSGDEMVKDEPSCDSASNSSSSCCSSSTEGDIGDDLWTVDESNGYTIDDEAEVETLRSSQAKSSDSDFIRSEDDLSNFANDEVPALDNEIPLVKDNMNDLDIDEEQGTAFTHIVYEDIVAVMLSNVNGMTDKDLERLIEQSLCEKEKRMRILHESGRKEKPQVNVKKIGSIRYDEDRKYRKRSKRTTAQCAEARRRKHGRRRKQKPMTVRRFIRKGRRTIRNYWTYRMTFSVLLGMGTLGIGIFVLVMFAQQINNTK